jgi:hypothetical protein
MDPARVSEIILEAAPDSAARFLRAWYGPRRDGAERPSSTPLPLPLRRVYGLVRLWPEAIVHNDLLAPPEFADIKRDEWADVKVEDERLVFYVENQGVCLWATQAEHVEDAHVWIRGSVIGGELSEWTLEEPALSHFLLQLLSFEAMMGASNGASAAWLDWQRVDQALAPLDRLPFGAWRWPAYPTHFYVGERILAVAGPNPGPGETERSAERASLTIGALDDDALAYLDEIVDDTWESFSRRDGTG